MTIILYNPLSSKGKNKHIANKLCDKYKKKGLEVGVKNLLEIADVSAFIASLKDDDKVIICGGDGTLHRIINTVDLSQIKQELFLYKGGSGNDFIKSLPLKGKIVKVNDYVKEFPVLDIDTGLIKVANGAGVGLDGMVCARVNKSKELKNRSNYFKNTLISFFKFKPTDAKFLVDGKEFEYKKVWLASVMYGDCFGGGMKIASGKKRNDGEVQLIILKGVPRIILFAIFPTIYLGWHKALKRIVKVFNAKSVEVWLKDPSYMQVDGETHYPISHYKMTI